MIIITGGKEVPSDVSVSSWLDHGSCFRKLLRRRSTTKIVLHWTGAENHAQTMFDNLTEKQLSVHFCIDQFGKVWQFADLADTCWHAGRLDDGFTSANEDTIGIEIINRAGEDQGDKWKRPMVNGREWFLPAQVNAVRGLCASLCRYYKLPMAAPMQDGQVITKALTTGRWRQHRGIVGHYHARSTKLDPGPELLAAVCELVP